MKYFQQIGAGVDVLPLLHAVQRQPDLWNRHRFRTTYHGTPHADVDDILLRFSAPEIAKDSSGESIAAVMGDNHPIWHAAAMTLPQLRPIVLDLMRRVEAYELNRLVITRLRPGGRIHRHADNEGAYVHDPDRARYHLVLQGMPGSLFHCGDETVCMLTGTVWWFDAHSVHECVNNSADDRVHLLVDVRTMP